MSTLTKEVFCRWACCTSHLSLQPDSHADGRQAKEAEMQDALKVLISTECEVVTRILEDVRGAVLEQVAAHNEAICSASDVTVLDIKRPSPGNQDMKVDYSYTKEWQCQVFKAEQLLGRGTGGEDGGLLCPISHSFYLACCAYAYSLLQANK
jgi:hypothetical protein